MELKLRSGRFCVSVERSSSIADPAIKSKNCFHVRLFYKRQLLLQAKIHLQLVNFNQHAKDFAVKVLQKGYRLF